MADDDGMSPEDLERLYNAPSSNQGPEGARDPEREPPVWRDSDQHQDRHDAALREEQRLEALRAQTARVRGEERMRQLQYEAEARERLDRQEHERELDLLRKEEQAAARQREHEEAEARRQREHEDHVEAMRRLDEDLDRSRATPIRRPLNMAGLAAASAPMSQGEVFLLGFLVGAAASLLCVSVSTRLRTGRWP